MWNCLFFHSKVFPKAKQIVCLFDKNTKGNAKYQNPYVFDVVFKTSVEFIPQYLLIFALRTPTLVDMKS